MEMAILGCLPILKSEKVIEVGNLKQLGGVCSLMFTT